MAKKTLLLQPVQGKFVQVILNNKTVKIWLVNPDTNEQGTEVLYDDGIKLLALPHPVVCPAQVKGKDGKYVQQLDDDDRALIEKRKVEYLSGESSVSESSSNTSTLEKLVETQAELIKSQNTQIQTMQSEFAEMKAMFAEIQKSNKKTSKKEKEESAE